MKKIEFFEAKAGDIVCAWQHHWHPEDDDAPALCPECKHPLYQIAAIDNDGYEWLSITITLAAGSSALYALNVAGPLAIFNRRLIGGDL
jgi:hypothetical protein